MSADNIRKFQSKLNKLRDISNQLSISPAETAIRFCVSNPDVSCVIPGIRTQEQAKQNCMSSEPLPAEAMKQLIDVN